MGVIFFKLHTLIDITGSGCGIWKDKVRGGKKQCKMIVSVSLPLSRLQTVVSFQVKVSALCSLERDTAVISVAQILLNQPGATWNTQAAPVKKVQK